MSSESSFRIPSLHGAADISESSLAKGQIGHLLDPRWIERLEITRINSSSSLHKSYEFVKRRENRERGILRTSSGEQFQPDRYIGRPFLLARSDGSFTPRQGELKSFLSVSLQYDFRRNLTSCPYNGLDELIEPNINLRVHEPDGTFVDRGHEIPLYVRSSLLTQ